MTTKTTKFIAQIFYVATVFSLNVSCILGLNDKSFPPGFAFGVSTSAYQIEGAWNESGKGESTWDYITHTYDDFIIDKSNGDVACDSYHKIDEDIALLKHLGVNFYRFSISWSRIVPNGNVSEGVNLAGVEYYQKLLRKLKEANIDAMVTLLHFDPPQILVKRQFLLDENLNSLFLDYARLAFMFFGDKVKYWTTFNEPREYCTLFLEVLSTDIGRDSYTCVHNVIKTHAMVYRMYEREFRDQYGGKISIVLNSNWDEPATELSVDKEAAKRQLLFEFGWFAHPLIFGDYPQVMKSRIRFYTFPLVPSRLPKFTKEEKKLIQGTLDFIGLNHYTTSYITDQPNNDFSRNFEKDEGTLMTYDPSWEPTSLSWLYVVPFGVRKILNWIDKTYNIPIIITENGYVEDGSSLEDDRRINYYQNYFSYILDAIYVDKVNLIGYSTWSLMDNWEWSSGYTQKFGLYSVNFSSPNRERTPKKSVAYYKKVLESRCIVDNCK